MATDRRIIEEQLAHAKKTGNKARAKKLEGILHNVKDYEAGKSQRKQRNIFDDWDNFHRGKSEARDHTHYRGNQGMTPGDPKLARKQKWARHGRTFQKVNRNPDAQLGVTLGGAAVAGVSGWVATYAMNKEASVGVKKQVGVKHAKRRRMIRHGYTAWGTGMGAYAGGVVGLSTKGGLAAAGVGAVAGGIGGRKLGKFMGPENKMNQKQWIVYTRHAPGGPVQRVKRKNPYYGKSKKR